MIPVLALGCLLSASAASHAQVLYDNGAALAGTGQYGLVTNPGGGSGGADASLVTAPDTTFGQSANTAGPFRLADDFTVPAGFQWTITGAHLFSYTTGSAVTTVTAATAQFFNGAPNAGGTVIAGDTTTNVFTSAAFANIFRAASTTPTDANRHVQDATLTFGSSIVLQPGTYWFDFGETYSTGAGFMPPITLISGAGVTGNSLQQSAGVYAPWTDLGSGNAKGMPFILLGTASPVPEPTSLALVGLVGAAGMSWRRWRKK
jgi:hypothetical protein